MSSKGSGSGLDSLDEEERSIEQWRIKKLVKTLENAKGEGTSMISLILAPKTQLSQTQTMLTEEYGTASNIKSRVNRLSVLEAIVSTQQRLKLYNKCPPNGLCIFCGTISTDKGPKKITIDFEPFKPINTSLYLCDNKFHTEPLGTLLESDDKFGFIIMDGNGALFGTLQGNTRNIITQFTVDLPKKHGRGGQSSVRFARLRMEKRHNYVRRVAEVSVQCFITNDKVNVAGLVLAGSADFKTELSQSETFDQRLQAKIIKIVDVAYGGENGFNQAINLASDTLSNVHFVQEKALLQQYFDEIGQDTGKFVFGIRDTIAGLEMGAVQKLIMWENLDVDRIELRHPTTGDVSVVYLTPAQQKDPSFFHEKGVELVLVSKEQLTDWFVLNYKKYGCTLHFVTNRSSEGSQFCRGFGGIGGLLRYKVDFSTLDAHESFGLMDDDEAVGSSSSSSSTSVASSTAADAGFFGDEIMEENPFDDDISSYF
ncbi:putative Eukaryotic peptide chain release factor subunit 1-2 [Monocercomonoides exilis]|uniref:putative Eukaryotic peptide chain release factor subunit 1-2 n=1 Tax=Monocercomonoides exilis TaxID=2049356 RepID=UPI00355A7929|nr:putative Eukaryotic peptide chain release factor subunit 1-2 [Monocercomonoides exilis]|eukprot:MONOS_10422.1-p1 / transcript=MONOS_10422.1 / gene=MONOS_10422 / organism=Monocercomonoides_exilis_PA203 / gene_product=Eukaryotic peptide chain release factor subunit 1-2 / transcript_product=Eukaryotic peptide chain release factor subunit 1-2 / location=Mono_scaffold00474:8064-9512(+) / protein_length=483 / sequence_SO=supercontig / SO=protein_coding / is_pseudo=false